MKGPVALLAIAMMLVSSTGCAKGGRAVFGVLSANHTKTKLQETEVEYGESLAYWGSLMPGGGARVSDMTEREIPARAVFKWEVNGVAHETEVLVPSPPSSDQRRDNLDLVFTVTDEGVRATWDTWSLSDLQPR